jgi:hypothetical protein
VSQVKHDLMMLWMPTVRRRWKAHKVNQRGIAAIGLEDHGRVHVFPLAQ